MSSKKKVINQQNELRSLYRSIHALILRISLFVFIITNLISLHFNKLEISLFISIIIISIQYLSYRFIQNENLKLFLISSFWISWYFLLVFIRGGMPSVHYFYYLFLFTLVLYQSPRIFGSIAIIVLAFNIFYFSPLGEFPAVEELITNYFYSETPNYVSFITHLIQTNLGLIIVWRISILLQKYSKTNILNEDNKTFAIEKNQEKQNTLLEKNKAFAEEIAKGNFEVKLNADSNDLLGLSLESMKDSLQKAKEREALEKKMNDFKNVGLIDIAKILRSETTIENMTKRIISVLTKYMNANIGAIYLAVSNKNGEIKHLELKSTFAYDRERHKVLTIEPGSGLVGTCFVEKESIFLTDIPENYIKIKSVLGETQPKCLLFSPLIANEEIVGVIELASVKIFKEYEVDFVNTISETIASTIINIKRNQQTAELLAEAKNLTVEMQEKEEELKQNMEEMKATQEETALKINKLESELSKYQKLS